MNKTFLSITGLFFVLTMIVFVAPVFIPVPELENTKPPNALADADSKFVDVMDIEIHYKQDGSGDREIVLLHGFGASVFSWRKVMSPLSEHGQVTAYDRPAFGLTERPDLDEWEGLNPYSIENQPEILVSFLDKLNIDRAVLIGNSAGGTLAVQTALDYPERVTSLILVDPAIINTGGTPGFLDSLLKLPQIDRIGPLISRLFLSRGRDALERAWHDPSKITEDDIKGYTKIMLVNDWDRAFWEFVRSSNRLQVADRLDELDLPVLVISGDDDRLVPPGDSREVSETIPGSEFVLLDQCGHVPQEECPDALFDAVSEFLEDLPR